MVSSVLGSDFQKYMDAFKPFLAIGLKNYAEYQVSTDHRGTFPLTPVPPSARSQARWILERHRVNRFSFTQWTQRQQGCLLSHWTLRDPTRSYRPDTSQQLSTAELVYELNCARVP